MRNPPLISLIFIIAVVVQSCSIYKIDNVEGTVKYTPKRDDVFTSSSFREYIRKTKSPSIVLRVPNSENSVLNESVYGSSNVYSAIEKELMKANFSVRDRALFNEILSKGQTTDYSKIRDKTDTDLILEVIESSPIKLSTNQYTDKKGRDKTANFPITYYGFKVEFKIINIKDNSVAGNYTFYYTPCLNGCTNIYYANGEVRPINYKDRRSSLQKMQDDINRQQNPKAYEYRFDRNRVYEFYKHSTQRLISEIKK